MRRPSTMAAASAMLVALVLASSVGATVQRTSSTLQIHAVFHVKWHADVCPPGTPSTTNCYPNVGQGIVPGLGRATEGYVVLMEHADRSCGEIRFVLVLTVAGKGEIRADGNVPPCVDPNNPNTPPAHITVTGGSGAYAGATGSGVITSIAHETGYARGTATDTWAASLSVPGASFDLTPPTLTAPVDKVVRATGKARRVRVRYRAPSAMDDVDGQLPVACLPSSGSLFKVGRTSVRCSAMDTSGNTATTRFAVIVSRT